MDRAADVALNQLVEHLLHVVATRLRLVMHVLQLQRVALLLLVVVTHLRHAVVNQLVEHLLQQHADVIRDAAAAVA